ncbi:MAG: hypothetical protein LBR70_03435 [Lactobacillaceae bacterium]|jgi:hypothetical protein|nr:hypothetical protein [Lactobacillaceae bacterium]
MEETENKKEKEVKSDNSFEEAKEKKAARTGKIMGFFAGLTAFGAMAANAGNLPNIEETADKELNDPKNKKEVVVENKKGDVVYSRSDTSDRYYVNPEDYAQAAAALKAEASSREYKSPEEFKKLSKEEKADHLRSGTSDGLNFVTTKMEAHEEANQEKYTFLEKWYKKGKEKKSLETDYSRTDVSPSLSEIFDKGKYNRDHEQVSVDQREVNLRGSGIPKDNTKTVFRQITPHESSDRQRPLNKVDEFVQRDEFRSDGTLKREIGGDTHASIDRNGGYKVETSSSVKDFKRDGETVRKTTEERVTETPTSRESVKTVSKARKDKTKVRELVETLRGTRRTKGTYDAEGKPIGKVKTKTKDFDDKQVEQNIQEQQEKGLSPAMKHFMEVSR